MFPVDLSTSKNCYVRCGCFIFNFIKNQQCAFFLSIEQEYILKQSYSVGRGHILFDISFANKSETDSNIFDLTNIHY